MSSTEDVTLIGVTVDAEGDISWSFSVGAIALPHGDVVSVSIPASSSLPGGVTWNFAIPATAANQQVTVESDSLIHFSYGTYVATVAISEPTASGSESVSTATEKLVRSYPPPSVSLATSPAASNTISAVLGTANASGSGDPLKVTLLSDAMFGTSASLVLNNGTLVYTPGLITTAKAGPDVISYTVTDTVSGLATTETQTVTLSNGPAPVMSLVPAPVVASGQATALGTASPRRGNDALKVALTADTDFATSSTLMLNSGTLVYTPGSGAAALNGTDTVSYTVTDTVTGAVTAETQTVVLKSAPAPVVKLAATAAASNAQAATLGTAAAANGADPLKVTLTADSDFASGSSVMLNSGTLVYTPGLITAATPGTDTIGYTVTDTATGVTTKETQIVTLNDGPSPIVTLATVPVISTGAAVALGSAAPGRGGDPLRVTLTSDAAFATGSTLVLNNGTILYTPGSITAARAGADTVRYSITDLVTGASVSETETITLGSAPPPAVTLAAAPAAMNGKTAVLGTVLPGKGTDALSVTLTSDAAFASGSTLVLVGGTLVYTPGLVTAAQAGPDTIKYVVTDTVTGAAVTETQTVSLSNRPAPVVTLATTPNTANGGSAVLGTAAPSFGSDPLKVALTSDADFASGSAVVLNNGTLTYKPGVVSPAMIGADTISYTVTDTVTGAVTTESETVVIAGYVVPFLPTTILASQDISTFIATSGALNSRDSLTGASGSANTLILSGGGVFDLDAPKTLANIQTVVAAEGQPASTGVPGSGASSVVLLRDGMNVTLNVVSTAPTVNNGLPSGIVIYGGADASIINLGTGSDTAVLGSASETVNANAGGGLALVQATAAQAGAPVQGTTAAATTLEIIGGGAATLNAATTHVTVQLDQATNLTLGKLGFITAVGQAAGNTITAEAANQTLGGLAGGDTLIGYSGFGDLFQGSSLGLNGDTIKGFGGLDRIDITDMAFGSGTRLTYTGNLVQGTLSVTNGAHSVAMTLVGAFSGGDFAAATDTHSGTLITYL